MFRSSLSLRDTSTASQLDSQSSAALNRERKHNLCCFLLIPFLSFWAETIHPCVYFSQASKIQGKPLFASFVTDGYLQHNLSVEANRTLQTIMKQRRKAKSFRPWGIKRFFTLLKENWLNLICEEEQGKVEDTHEEHQITKIGCS